MGIIVLLLVLGAGLLVYMFAEAKRNRVVYHDVPLADFPDSFGEIRIFFISDIHRRLVSSKLLDQISGTVDLVIIGGDLAEKGVPMDQIRANLNALKKIGPLYFVWGNNDYEVDYHELDALMLNEGVTILDNRAVKFESEKQEILYLLGVDDMSERRDRLDLAINDCEEPGFRLLVSHNPDIVHKIKAENQISFVLSGHTHGGQIRIFNQGPYEKGGFKKSKNTLLFVSNGYGTTKLPLRLEAKSEANYVTLKKMK
ncbi:metallophosphoesterase [Priestia koreensis]|uniref:Metallophosphoesterase n=1 Tax=Priestia koreensis TaxID=284581 RepID=A0A0M0KZ27_9BACI|nr:metallophosphoesterase [Priestia koreensis]KOO44070.1 metallophosphoesterase [Priestia koreensis]